MIDRMTTAISPDTSFATGVAPATLSAAFQRSVALYPDRVALRHVGHDEQISWSGYARRVERAGAALAALGIGRGDTVALLLTNRPEAAWVDVAAMLLGATTVSLYVASSAGDLEHMLGDSGAGVVVTERAFAGRIEALRDACPALRHVVGVDGAEPGMESMAAVEAAADSGFDLAAHCRDVSPDDVVCLLYTSGTTGPPKGVQHTHATMLAVIRAFEAASPEQTSVNYVSYLPLAHIGERAIGHYRALLRGSTTTFCPDPARLAAALAEARPTWLFGPPAIWRKLRTAVEAKLAAEPGLGAAHSEAVSAVRARRARRDGPATPSRDGAGARRAARPARPRSARARHHRSRALPAGNARVLPRPRPAVRRALRNDGDRRGHDDSPRAGRRRHRGPGGPGHRAAARRRTGKCSCAAPRSPRATTASWKPRPR